METPGNKTHSGFILLGFSDIPHLLLPLFCVFLVTYSICIAGNILIFVLIVTQYQLHTPMYVLMGNLAFVDVFFTSIIIPRALYGLLSGDTHISTHACFAQQFFFVAVGNMDSFLLAIMAFDRYSAICFPLHYMTIMSNKTCICLVASSWVIVCLHSTLYFMLTSSQVNCRWVIHNFYCDLPVVLHLTCTQLPNAFFFEGAVIIFGPVLFILVSYLLIIRAVLALHSSQGRGKTFSTCSSHLTMVILFYSTVIFMYFRPRSIYAPTYDRVISVVFSVIIPMLNPFIYSLRNKEVKAAVKKAFCSFGSVKRVEERHHNG